MYLMKIPLVIKSTLTSDHYVIMEGFKTDPVKPGLFYKLFVIRGNKGLERPRLIGSTGAGFYHAWTTTKASAPCMEAR